MDRVRRRVAIGLFANFAAVEAVVRRLDALGVKHCEYLALPGNLPLAELALNPAEWTAIAADELSRLVPGEILLRVNLETQATEQIVAKALLESPALSVQLHDINPPAAAAP